MDILENLAERYVYNQKSRKIPVILLVSGMMAGVYCLVYFTGGIKYVYSHSMYIPIVFSALVFGVKGGILAGLAGGLVLGPYMPIDVVTGEKQEAINWIYRTSFFILIGAVTGFSMDLLRRRLDHINWLMHNNPHTSLPNSESLNKKLSEVLADTDIKNKIYLLSIGSSNLAIVKSTFGFNVVHTIIKQMHNRLEECLLFNHGLFNHHAEQMAVILECQDDEAIDEQINNIVHVMKLPFEYENIPVHIDFHIGSVSLRDGDTDAYSLQRKADIALNHAIEQKIDYFIYKQEADKTNKKNVGLLGSLNNAIETDQLVLHYQPKVDIHTREMLGVEALLRWEHPEDGMIPPGNFIPQAEQTNLINPITEWVINKALARMSAWTANGFHPVMAVNISARNLQDPAFEETVFRLMEKHNVPPQRLEFEVTETALMNNPKNAIRLLTRLANSKITISIDDFGTGYSSLEYLCELPATIIKIDQYFVRNISQDNAVKNIIESATKLAHSLDMEVVAEGVEDEEGLKFLTEIGCDIVQGFYISRPIPERELLAYALVNHVH